MSDRPGLDWIVYNIAGLLAGFMITDAGAQNASPNPPQVRPAPQTDGQGQGDPSGRLDRNRGVIRPKGDVDPGMSAAPPDSTPGAMQVIPPPGSPGGDPRVQPK